MQKNIGIFLTALGAIAVVQTLLTGPDATQRYAILGGGALLLLIGILLILKSPKE